MSKTTNTATFGASDGLIASLALVLVASTRGQAVVLLALFGLLVAEGLGMAASQYLADPAVSLRQAAVMGVATSITIIAVGLPWTFTRGSSAILASVGIAVGVAAVISWLRPGNWETWGQTFGILLAVSTVAVAVGRLS